MGREELEDWIASLQVVGDCLNSEGTRTRYGKRR